MKTTAPPRLLHVYLRPPHSVGGCPDRGRCMRLFAVLELKSRPNWWRVWVDGKPATAPLHLRGSHGRWSAQVLGESWAGNASGTCNTYRYSFDGVSLLAEGGRVPAFHDPNYAVL